jgi:acyl-coenzyme A thioesterase PaaI-like protein
MRALQDHYAPLSKCFGCGPLNEQGLRIKSMVEGDVVVAHFLPKPHHQAFDSILSGGICGTLLDCHSNWTAAYAIMKHLNLHQPLCTVTAKYAVELLAPTPLNEVLKIVAKVITVSPKKASVEAEILANDKRTAFCEGLFVAVSPGHPAYHRW